MVNTNNCNNNNNNNNINHNNNINIVIIVIVIKLLSYKEIQLQPFYYNLKFEIIFSRISYFYFRK